MPQNVEYTGSRANIFNRKRMEFERFEPYGSIDIKSDMLEEQFDKTFEKFIKLYLGNNVKYFRPLDYCPNKSFQTYNELKKNSDEGFCVAWSIWYLHLRMTYPSINRKMLVKQALNDISKSRSNKFRTFIRNYGNYLDKEVDRIDNDKLMLMYSQLN